MKKTRVSVAMATFNGEKYIKEQLRSILDNLRTEDEVIISDDGSSDSTIEIIKGFNDDRIKIINGPKKGVKKNFEYALKHTTGEIIFLSDQDDIWNENKLKTVLNIFEEDENITLVMHDAMVFDSENNNVIQDSFFKYRKSKKGVINNIIKNSYIGCCIAFRKKLMNYIFPIPNRIEMHDQWIGLISDIYGNNFLCKDVLLEYRRHNCNVSKMTHYPLLRMIINRVVLIFSLIMRCIHK